MDRMLARKNLRSGLIAGWDKARAKGSGHDDTEARDAEADRAAKTVTQADTPSVRKVPQGRVTTRPLFCVRATPAFLLVVSIAADKSSRWRTPCLPIACWRLPGLSGDAAAG